MIVTGKSISKGYAIGEIVVWEKEKQQISLASGTDASKEVDQFLQAVKKVKEELLQLYSEAITKVGEKEAEVFQAYQLILEDAAYQKDIISYINDCNVTAKIAVAQIKEKYVNLFLHMEDEYMKERAADIEDLSNRLIEVLDGRRQNRIELNQPSILATTELSASELMLLDSSKILGIILRKGSQHSHASILMKSMNIPALIGVDYPQIKEGTCGLLDGNEGKFYINPTQEETNALEKKMHEQNQMRIKENDGKKKISILANVSGIEDAKLAFKNKAEGIGLYRSEFLFLKEKECPTEELQYQTYRKIAELAEGKLVVIRTLDIGADKKVTYFPMEDEKNPALGLRGIRFCLKNEELFMTQLRAILRASNYGNIAVMLPMIVSVDEVREAKRILSKAKISLDAEEIKYKPIELGIMIETPAAVMISDQLAPEVDFFSIGTNDLTQYVLAMDRENAALEEMYDVFHPALEKMMQIVIDHAHRNGRKVGVCGQLAADPSYTDALIQMGVDELSVPPAAVASFR